MRGAVARFLIVLALLTLQIYTLVDLVRADADQVRTLPKAVWLLVWLVPVLGPLAWILLGRPQVGPSPGGGGGSGGGGIGGGPRPTRGPLAPDDDPDFLRRLDEQTWSVRMERLRRERQGLGGSIEGDAAEGDEDPPPGQEPSPDSPTGSTPA